MTTTKKSKLISAISIILVCALSLGSIALAGAVNEHNTAYEAKATYQGKVRNINLYESHGYENFVNGYHTSNGTATYTNFMGITVFRASYFGMPEDKVKAYNDFWQEQHNNQTSEYKDFTDYYTDYYELIMDKKVRGFGSGFGLEGLFTLTKNGEAVFESQTGYLSFLPTNSRLNAALPADTTLSVTYEKDEKPYLLSMNIELYTPTPEQNMANRKRNVQFLKSRETKTVRLGEAVEVIANGENIDVNEINKYLPDREEWSRYSSDIQYNPSVQMASAYCSAGESSNLAMRLGNKASVTHDSIKGEFLLYSRIDVTDIITMTVTGLDNPVGGFVEFKSEDGRYFAKYEIVPIIHAPLSYRGTKDLSEIEQEENVFVGTPREQDDFDRDEHDRFYQRIILDDYGKVLMNVPTSLQQGEILNIEFSRITRLGQSWENLIGSAANTFLTKIDGTIVDSTENILVYQDAETWWIKAVIPAEYQFMERIPGHPPYVQRFQYN